MGATRFGGINMGSVQGFPAEDPPDAPRTKDFPGETFRVPKEIKKHGEYRAQCLVLKAWDRMSEGAGK